MTTPKTLQSSIVIAGAGLVGTSFALCMKDLGLSIHILENHLPDIITQSKQDSRPISLSFGSVRILMALGIWKALENVACPILAVHVSEQGRFGSTRFSATEQNVPALGYVVPFAQLQSALYHRAAAQSHITISSIKSIESIHNDLTGAHITINAGEKIIEMQADLFVAADGTQSTCRDLLHIPHTEKNHDDTAHIYQLQLSKNHTHTAYERFTAYGVLAVLPLHDHHRAQLVWTITPRIAKTIMDWDEKQILTFLQDTFDGRLSKESCKNVSICFKS